MCPQHFISVDDWTIDTYRQIFADSARIKDYLRKHDRSPYLHGQGQFVSLVFAEASTRTSESMDAAAQFLGFNTRKLIVENSSISKGESYEHTLAMMALYSKILVVRHRELEGELRRIAGLFADEKNVDLHSNVGQVSIINAGEGTGEHPTQAVLDMFTIYEHFARIGRPLDQIKLGIFGDMDRGRTCHSLSKLASKFGASITCIAPEPILEMPAEYLGIIEKNSGKKPVCVSNIDDVIGDLDVIYVLRKQHERREDSSNPDKLLHLPHQKSSGYCLTHAHLERMPRDAIALHPMPMLDEVQDRCATNPRRKHFTQAANGIPTRIRIMMECLGLH
jgi:aspartate carbamoyltransferase